MYVPPRMRSRSPGALLGHKVTHGPAHLFRAVVEGWALAGEDALYGLGEPDRLQDVVCIGGGSGSSLWVQVKASLLGREIQCVRTPEIVAVGAALLAAQGLPEPGLLADWKPEASVVAPVQDWIPRYRTLSREFMRLAPMIHPDAGFHVYP